MAETTKGFWHTAPGLITAVAALVTALGGVLGLLMQYDVIGGGGERPSPATTQAGPGTGAPAVTPAATGVPDDTGLIPWDRAEATLQRRDGTSVTVRAATVGLACDREKLAFKNGQQIGLEIVRSIRFDAIYTENGSADGVVTLLDGRELTDPVHTWNCPVRGAGELGPVDIALEDIGRIDFRR